MPCYVYTYYCMILQFVAFCFIQVCLKTGDPNKFMFCKRCDGAHHCYYQQPSHKVGCKLLVPKFYIIIKRTCLYLFVDNAECQFWTLFVPKTYKVSQLCIHCPWKWLKCEVLIVFVKVDTR